MATPYLGQPNYLGAMQLGLTQNRAFNGTGGTRVRRSGTTNAIREPQKAPMGSPEARAEYRKNILAEEAAVEAVEQSKQKTEAGEIGLQEKSYDTVAKGISTAAKFAPQLTKENYDDWFKWVGESDFLPSNMFVSPKEVNKFSPDQFTQYTKKIEELSDPDDKSVKYAIDMYKAENAALARQNKNILDREKQTKLDTHNKAIIDLKEKELKQKADLAADKTTSEGRKFTELTADQKAKTTSKEEDKLLEIENQIFSDDAYARDKQGSKSYVDAYNRKAKKLGIPEEIVWTEEEVIPGKIWGTKTPGYVKIPVEEAPTKVQERTTPKEEIEAMKSGEIFWVDGKQYRRK